MARRRSGILALLALVAAGPAATVQPFDLRDVRLLDPSPLVAAQRLNADYLLSLEPDRFLHYFRAEAGLPPRAPAYGAWESPDQGAGRCLGHYLSALAAQYRATGDERFRARVDHIVDKLAACQQANGDGSLSAQRGEKQFWADLAAGHAEALRRHRVPWYIQHKLFAGLRDAHLLAGNAVARDLLVRLGDWAIGVTAKLDDAGFQRMLDQEHGGMREAMVDLFALTGDPRHLALAQRFEHRALTDPLAAGRDALDGLHANTQLAKVVGSARAYELTGDGRDRRVAEAFWRAVVDHHSYANGGNSDDERFGPPDRLPLGLAASETCNTYNLLKLTRHLIGWDPRPALGDVYERALYNHLLAAVGPTPGNYCYYTPIAGGHARMFSRPTGSFWCCVGTGMENPAQYGLGFYFHDDRDLYVNLYGASAVTWRGVTFTQATAFPQDGRVTLAVRTDRPANLAIHLRIPAWADGATVTVNGSAITATPGQYAVVDRTWADGDMVTLDLPMRLRTEPLLGHPDQLAVCYGPLLLAGRLAAVDPATELLGGSPAIPKDAATVPELTVAGRPVDAWITRTSTAPLGFRTHDAGLAQDVELVPFYAVGASRYCLYWPTR